MPKTKLRRAKKTKTVTIVLKVQDYEKLLDDLDELEAIRAFDAAKKSGETPIPFEKAFPETSRHRR